MLRFHLMNPFDGMQREVEHLLRGFDLDPIVRREQGRINFIMREHDEKYQVEAALPGVNAEKLDINVVDRQLVIKGEFAPHDLPDNARVHRQERRSGCFEQSLMLTSKFDRDNIAAEYKDGILSISIPKAKEALPRRIEIKAG
ncbi:Hsp20/alpha crystallin family protein [Pelovirga terrestris]|uniref:Hsp20/alpha crystallin family protein n=1 Tax=Pelovirga terrestris TaxID=2771352 RepID=A0A8J6QYD4_9BACT|nr:Hsp20/alpha crystallin family protein [Pelovirga terrestris]MBD1401133.1 Hsp20/alpha crystallin family protein [Pelovirga terrestris]